MLAPEAAIDIVAVAPETLRLRRSQKCPEGGAADASGGHQVALRQRSDDGAHLVFLRQSEPTLLGAPTASRPGYSTTGSCENERPAHERRSFMGQWSRIWLCCISDGVPKRSLIVALIVGTILNLINQGDALVA